MKFRIGCNYWDSASGTDMWRKWAPDVIEKDLDALAACGVDTLRVFPNWREFQPVKKLYTWAGGFGEYVFGEDELALDENPSGIDPVMVARFREFAAMAEKRGMSLIVSLVTGWMSGRLFVPPAIEGKNLLRDPEVMMWTDRYVKGLVGALRDLPNIIMWEPGNECNCMAQLGSAAEAYTWIAFVTNAIRATDSTRPVSSGMHSLVGEQTGIWQLSHQGEIFDMLTTHPYPSKTIQSDREPFDRMRTTIMPTAQSVFYRGLSGRPVMIEEQGTFAPNLGNREMSGDFVRVNMLSAWANGLGGYLWWCGMEHIHLTRAPYAWSMMERQLGMLDSERSPKPAAREMKRMAEVISRLPEPETPHADAVCVLPRLGAKNQAQFTACSSYILAKQAGFEVAIRSCETVIPESELYIMPCVEGWQVTYRRTYDFLLDRVHEHGADLLVTFDGGSLTQFEEFFGLRSHGVREMQGNHVATFPFGELRYTGSREIFLESIGAEVLATNEEGNIVMSRYRFGRGYVYFLNFPPERLAFARLDGYDTDKNPPYYKIYRMFAEGRLNRIATCDNPAIGLTERLMEDGSYLITAINYTEKPQEPTIRLRDGYSVAEVLYGTPDRIGKCDGLILKVIGC